MNSHRFDPVSALLAILAVAAGVLTIGGLIDPFADADAGLWLAIAAIAVALTLLPWSRTRSTESVSNKPDT